MVFANVDAGSLQVFSKISKKSYLQNSNDFEVFSDGEARCRVSY
jgi:hypothetical protein